MATEFVDSTKTGGANDGTSWTDAYLLLSSCAFGAGDIIYVRSIHAESTASTVTITGTAGEGTSDPARVICVVGAATGTTPGALATGAVVENTGAGNDIYVNDSMYVYGVEFKSIDQLFLALTGSDCDQVFENVTFTGKTASGSDHITVGGSGVVGKKITWINCSLNLAGGSSGAGIQSHGADFRWVDGTLVSDHVALLKGTTQRFSMTTIGNVDMSALTGSLSDGSLFVSTSKVAVTRCLLGTGATVTINTIDVPGVEIEARHCQIGTDADPAYQLERHSDRGSVTAMLTPYRDGGASDGERTNPISWKMTTDVGSKRLYPGHALESPPIVGWTDGDASTAHTYRVYFASDGTQQDDDVWMVLTGPNDAATNSLGVQPAGGPTPGTLYGTRLDPMDTAANHTTDGTSTWTGSNVGTKQYMEITYTPDKPGPISVILYCGEVAGTTKDVYFDPKIYIDP